MNDQKIDKETAELEFDRFIEMMDIDVDPEFLDDEDKKALDTQKRRIVSAIMAGSMVINDSGEPEFTPQRSGEMETLRFREPTGAALMQMDRRKKNEDMGKLYAIMAEMAKVHSNTFAKMKMSDLRICQAVASLFLG